MKLGLWLIEFSKDIIIMNNIPTEDYKNVIIPKLPDNTIFILKILTLLINGSLKVKNK